jgi:hypothetical protein
VPLEVYVSLLTGHKYVSQAVIVEMVLLIGVIVRFKNDVSQPFTTVSDSDEV